MWNRFWNWFLGWFIDEYEVTIYFPGEVTTYPDGKKEQTFNSKSYNCKRVKIISDTEFKLLLTNRQAVKIKTVEPVGFDVTKIR